VRELKNPRIITKAILMDLGSADGNIKADSPMDTVHRWVERMQTKEDTTSPHKAHKSLLGL